MRLLVREAAEADIAEAARWYEQRSLGLGSEFLRAVDVALAEVRAFFQRAPRRQFPDESIHPLYAESWSEYVEVFARHAGLADGGAKHRRQAHQTDAPEHRGEIL